MNDPRQALDRLREAAASGELGALCRRHGVVLLVAFGSAVRSDSVPRDLDLAARFTPAHPDVLGVLDELSSLAGTSKIDLLNLGSAGPVARERALVGAIPLVEESSGSFASAQIGAMMERMDTAWLRRLDLDLMTRCKPYPSPTPAFGVTWQRWPGSTPGRRRTRESDDGYAPPASAHVRV